MNFSRGQIGTKVRCELRLSSQGKTPEFTKMGEILELFVLALSLVWFAGATPERGLKTSETPSWVPPLAFRPSGSTLPCTLCPPPLRGAFSESTVSAFQVLRRGIGVGVKGVAGSDAIVAQ